jgi:predicted PurR-regulated permease PerM
MVALAGMTALLLVACFWLALPYLPAITWGAALAIIAWPVQRRMRRTFSNPDLAAAASLGVVLVTILLPVVLISYQLGREAAAAANRLNGQSLESLLRRKLAEIPAAEQLIGWLDHADVDLEQTARNLVASYTSFGSDVALGSITALIQFLVAMYLLYHLFRDRAAFLHGARNLLPLTREEGDLVLTRAADSVHANLYSSVVTSLIDATSFGLLFWLFGIPSPLLWSVVMFVLAIIPVLGAGLIWVPAVIYMALSGRWPQAAMLLGWGIFTAIYIDNVLLARLAGGRMRMHPVLMLIAFLGGLALFGMSGMILGPAILAVTSAVLAVWKQRAGAGDAPPLAEQSSC